MRFTVASLEVVRTRDGDWEVNDQHSVGTVDISREVAESDQLLIDVLNSSGYLDNATIDDVYVIGESLDYLQFFDDETDRPVLALMREH